MDQFRDLPFGVAAASLFAIVMLRVNATYWIGRGAAAGVEHTRFASSWNGRRAGQAKELVRRWGPFAVTLSFLTIGLQTAVNLPPVLRGCRCGATFPPPSPVPSSGH